MRRFFALALLLIPFPLPAQTAPAKLQAAPGGIGCPVEATARRGSAADFLIVAGPEGAGKPALSLTLAPREGRRITEAEVAVHALSAKGRVWALQGNGNPEPDIVRRFTLTDTRATAAAFNSALALGQAATVAWVEITTLRYADGTAWHASTRAACRVTPEALTPVLARR